MRTGKGFGMQLNIVYEDKDILVCYKPAGIATQTAKLSAQDMVNMIKNHLARTQNIKNPYVGVIHRLDLPVSGLLVFAKNKKAAANLSKQIQDGNANKDYIALCSKKLKEKQGRLVHYIAKDSKAQMARIMDEETFLKNQAAKKDETSFYKKAVLTYEVEKEFEDSSIVRIHLETGRFHQIRAQFSAIGSPLLGDAKYTTAESKAISEKRQMDKIALCADRLVFCHPVSNKIMEYVLGKENLPLWYTN